MKTIHLVIVPLLIVATKQVSVDDFKNPAKLEGILKDHDNDFPKVMDSLDKLLFDSELSEKDEKALTAIQMRLAFAHILSSFITQSDDIGLNLYRDTMKNVGSILIFGATAVENFVMENPLNLSIFESKSLMDKIKAFNKAVWAGYDVLEYSWINIRRTKYKESNKKDGSKKRKKKSRDSDY